MELNYKKKSNNILKDVIYHDVTILSNGVWDQQDKKSRVFYPEEVLHRDAKNWKRNFIYAKHTSRKDGTPESAFNIVGFVEDPHYSNLRKAIVADLRILGSKKEIIEYIDKGIIRFLSPEVWTDDHYSYTKNSRIATKLDFNGVALVVDNPACKESEINRHRKSLVNST